jgi:hypothetical protein
MNARDLGAIEADLKAAFEHEAKGPIEVGALLVEAKEQFADHAED